jgi:AcrR family transcriptional regulator
MATQSESVAAPRTRTQVQRRDEARRRIVNAAVAIVARRGLDELTLAEAGEAAGYSRGLAGHYFGSKDDLVSQIAEQIVARYGAGLKKSQVARGGLAGVLSTVLHYLESARAEPTTVRALHTVLGAAIGKPALAPAIAKLNRDVVAGLARQIEIGIEKDEIRRDVDATAQATLILAGLRGVVAQWLVDPKGVDLTRTGKAFVASLKRGLAP